MDTLESRLKEVLLEFCIGQKVNEIAPRVIVGRTSLGRVFGVVVWGGFDGMNVTQRQDMIWNHIRQRLLDQEDRKNISAIYTRGSEEDIAEDELRTISDRRSPSR